MKYFKLPDYDVIFLSFDEPNADDNYRHLVKSIPWAKRVHGIKGSDTAHKECAKFSETDRLIIIDGDNHVNHEFLNQLISLNDKHDENNIVFSWPSINAINGLIYGNGGIKFWPKKSLLEMKTHENALINDLRSQVEFCWSIEYMPLDTPYSITKNNASKLQAFRSGFREGVKMSLDQGYKPENVHTLPVSNLRRLKIWLTVGMDVKNGIWGILGAWYGFYKTIYTDWDYKLVRDFDHLNQFYFENIEKLTEQDALDQISKFVKNINLVDTKFIIDTPFDSSKSIFVKSIDFNTKRQPNTIHSLKLYSGYDIVMITYDEPECDNNFERLIKRFPTAKRIHGVKGIHQAHIEAAKISNTEMFWVVDGDVIIDENFNFSFSLQKADDFVRVWRCKNPINDLVYGYGGVKLLPKKETLNMSFDNPDMTTSISTKFIPVQELSNITNFNVSEFHTWRSAFRECCKLASRIIDRQKNEETSKRLDIWCTVGSERRYGEYAIKGAIAGRKFGEENKNNKEVLMNINNFDWLRDKFNESN